MAPPSGGKQISEDGRLRSSLRSGSTIEDPEELTWFAQLVTRVQATINRYSRSATLVEEDETQQLADIIGTFRAVPEIDDEEDSHHFVDSAAFDLFMSVNIVLNTFVIGLETDLQNESEDRAAIWIVFEIYFVGVFVAEVVAKSYFHYKRRHQVWIIADFANAWTTFIAVLAFFDLCIIFPLGQAGVVEFSGMLRLVSLCRITGLLRLVRIIRHYKALDELRLVVEGLRRSGGTIAWVVALVTVFLYIMSIVSTKAIGQNAGAYAGYRRLSGGWDHEELFGTIGRSMYTLLEVMTLDGWSSRVARHVVNNQPYMAVFFMLFLLLSTNGLLNVVVGVIVERTLSIAASNEARLKARELRAKKTEIKSLEETFDLADLDSSKFLEKDEFQEAVKRKEVKERFELHNIAPEDAEYLFSSIEAASRGLNKQEFVIGCSKLKGVATSKDLLEVQAQAETLKEKMAELDRSIEKSEKLLVLLDEVSMRIRRRYPTVVNSSRRKIAHVKGGSAPLVPPKRPRPGMQEEIDHAIGNRPNFPQFPNFLS